MSSQYGVYNVSVFSLSLSQKIQGIESAPGKVTFIINSTADHTKKHFYQTSHEGRASFFIEIWATSTLTTRCVWRLLQHTQSKKNSHARQKARARMAGNSDFDTQKSKMRFFVLIWPNVKGHFTFIKVTYPSICFSIFGGCFFQCFFFLLNLLCINSSSQIH